MTGEHRPDPRRRVVGAALATGLLAAVHAVRSQPALVERWYAQGAGPAITGSLTRASALLPFSLAEVLLVSAVITLAVLGARGLWRLRRGPGRARRALHALAALVWAAASVLLVFELAWGLNYGRPPLPARAGWVTTPTASSAELDSLATVLVEAANDAYLAQAGSVDRGEPTPRDRSLDELSSALEVGWSQAVGQGLAPAGPAARVKPVLLSPVLAAVGISGFFFPWTGEANVNRLVPACALPHVIAHEMAHRRGFAPENEAEFAGWVAGALSVDPQVRYASHLFAQREVLRQLAGTDRPRALALLQRRHPGVQRDVEDLQRFWQRWTGPLTRLGRAVNDRYLRAQGVPDGVLAYGRVTELLVLYARAHPGAPLPAADRALAP